MQGWIKLNWKYHGTVSRKEVVREGNSTTVDKSFAPRHKLAILPLITPVKSTLLEMWQRTGNQGAPVAWEFKRCPKRRIKCGVFSIEMDGAPLKTAVNRMKTFLAFIRSVSIL
jgi:hypothetical protein